MYVSGLALTVPTPCICTCEPPASCPHTSATDKEGALPSLESRHPLRVLWFGEDPHPMALHEH